MSFLTWMTVFLSLASVGEKVDPMKGFSHWASREALRRGSDGSAGRRGANHDMKDKAGGKRRSGEEGGGGGRRDGLVILCIDYERY